MNLAADETKLFWVSSGYNRAPKGVFSVPKAGGTPTKLADVNQAMGVWPTKDNVYFYDAGPELFVMPKAGGKPVSMVENDALGPAAAGGDTLCWLGAFTPQGASEKRAAAPAPSASAQPEKFLDSDRRTIYCKKDGAARAVPVAPVTLFVQQLLVAGDRVYWLSSVDESIQSAAVSGGSKRTVASQVKGVTALVGNKSSILFVGIHGTEKGLFVVDQKGGAPRKLVALATEWTRDLAADETFAYYTLNRGLFRIAFSGGKPQAIFLGDVKAPKGTVLDDSSLYTVDGSYLRRLKKPSP